MGTGHTMVRARHGILPWLAAGVASALVGCQSPEGPDRTGPPNGVTNVTSRSVAWFNMDLQGSGWDKLLLAPLQVQLPPGFSVTDASRQEHAVAFLMAIRLRIGDAYPLVARPDERTLALSVRVVDRTRISHLLEQAGNGPLGPDGSVRGVALEIVARNSLSGELVAAAINQFEAPALAASLAQPGSQEDLVRVFLPFATRVRLALDQSSLRMLN